MFLSKTRSELLINLVLSQFQPIGDPESHSPPWYNPSVKTFTFLVVQAWSFVEAHRRIPRTYIEPS